MHLVYGIYTGYNMLYGRRKDGKGGGGVAADLKFYVVS